MLIRTNGEIDGATLRFDIRTLANKTAMGGTTLGASLDDMHDHQNILTHKRCVTRYRATASNIFVKLNVGITTTDNWAQVIG
jgi:hypothetical protein